MNRTVMMQKVRDADNFVVLFKGINGVQISKNHRRRDGFSLTERLNPIPIQLCSYEHN